ncbi:MAG: aldo/keto reductase [Opitutus sp.]|nr:aldo/keto reductase [Opitutus sp.]
MSTTIADKPVSALGLGCVTFGREIDEASSLVMMDDALARGITLLDTAAAYGGGASERIVGGWLATRRPATVIVATKVLPPYEPAKLVADFELCLTRLGVGSVDLLYLHQWHASADSLETLTALDGLVRAGKVRALGASNFKAPQLTAVLRRQKEAGLARFQVVQNNHNLAVSDLTPEFLEVTGANNLAVVTFSPLGAGFLTGKHRGGVEAGSRFAIIPGHQNIYFQERVWKRLERLEAVAARTGHTPAHLALAWAMHRHPVASVLVGGRTPAHLDQAFAAGKFNDPVLFAELEAE